MKQRLKLNPNTILILIILIMVLAANILNTAVASSSSDVATIQSYREATLPVNMLDLLKIAIIFLMGWMIFSSVKKAAKHAQWSNSLYRKIKQIGWLSVFVVVLDAISYVIREQYIAQNKSLSTLGTDATIYTDVISHALFSSPLSWFLIACIFLIADILNLFNNPKADH